MKKLIILMLALIILFAGCGKDDQNSQNPSGTQNAGNAPNTWNPSSTSEASNAAGTSSPSVPHASSRILIGSDTENDTSARYNYVPIYAYDPDENMGNYIYVDRKKLIDYIDQNEVGTYFPINEVASFMVLPYFYTYASMFDENNMAIVHTHEFEAPLQSAHLIDKQGISVLPADRSYADIEKMGDYYFCYRFSEDSFTYDLDIVDKDGRIVKTLDEWFIGVQIDENTANFYDGMFMNLDTLEMTDQPDANPLADEYSRAIFIADGYYAVANHTTYPPDIQIVLDSSEDWAVKKALTKNGERISDYNYYFFDHVKDDVFYVFDRDRYYFYDFAAKTRVFDFATDQVGGYYDFHYMPGLLVGYSNATHFGNSQVYFTGQSVAKTYRIEDDFTPYYIKSITPFPSFSSYPQFILWNKNSERKLNSSIEDKFLIADPFGPEGVEDLLSYKVTLVSDHVVLGDILKIYRYTTSESTTFLNAQFDILCFNMKSGDFIPFAQWVQDEDKAIAIIIAHATAEFQKLYPNAALPTDLDAFFSVNTWDTRVDFLNGRLHMLLPINHENVEDEFLAVTIGDPDLRTILKPEYYEWVKSYETDYTDFE